MTSSEVAGNNTTSYNSLCVERLYGFHLKILIATLNIPLSVTAILGNVLIIIALQNVSTPLRPPSKLLFRYLASTDLAVGLVTQPLIVVFLLVPEKSGGCLYLTIIGKATSVLFGGVSLLTLTAISVERLLALLLGIRYRQFLSLRRIKVMIFIFWLIGAAIAGMFIFRLLIAAVSGSILLLSCTATSTFCYTKIHRVLRHHGRQVNFQQEATGAPASLNIARYRKTLSTAMWVQMTFLACYLPFGIVQVIISVTALRAPSIDLARDLTGTIVFLNSTLNPFLYCWKIRAVRRIVKDKIRRWFCF